MRMQRAASRPKISCLKKISGLAMNRAAVALTLFALALALSISAPAQGTQGKSAHSGNKTTDRSSETIAARGKYIVEGLSRCGQCHTPRNSDGTPDGSHLLQGAPVWLKSAEPAEDWPLQAPRIGGVPPGTDAEMVTLLTTGIWKDGKPLRPPMPQFRMRQSDADAVVAYLKTLP